MRTLIVSRFLRFSQSVCCSTLLPARFLPRILSGALKILTGNSQLPPNVPCPLYIAALFMGLTQPVIPVLARLGEAQRNFFHNRIEIPRRIIDLTADLTVAIDRRSVSKGKLAADKLAAELRNLISDDWLASLGRCGDLAFYQQQLDKVQLDPGTAEKTLEEASPRELRNLLEELVFFQFDCRGTKVRTEASGRDCSTNRSHSVCPPLRNSTLCFRLAPQWVFVRHYGFGCWHHSLLLARCCRPLCWSCQSLA